MHEFSIATQILESVLEFAEQHPAAEVVSVRLEVGELMCVEQEQLRFCYDSIKQNTSLKDSMLEMEMAPAIVKCVRCEYEGPPKYWDGVLSDSAIPTLQCPKCGKTAEAIRGHDCAIKTIQLRNLSDTSVAFPSTSDPDKNQDEFNPFTDSIRSEA